MSRIIPTYDNGVWTESSFETDEDFIHFLRGIFKEPGLYEFDETSRVFNNQARFFNKNGYYCSAPFRSKDFINYWEDQKNKCRTGVIYKNKGKTWYITRDYYMWLNFLPIFDKEEKKYGFAKVRDAQYHMALYELLAELNNKHAAIFKKRQIASSYFHMGKIINTYWFEEGSVCKIGASLKDYINDKGSWKFLEEYKDFLNEHTAWYRPSNPEKVLLWQQQIEVRIGNKKTKKGLKSKIQGASFEKNATTGVGGPTTYFFHEEAGIAPKMMDTYEYLRPAMSSGMLTTGMFIAAGSVGDLDQCEPLKEMILRPNTHDIYAVETNLLDKDGTIGLSGLFIPEQWSMPPYIDKYGNSKIEEALEAIKKEREEWKRELNPEQYQLRISQKPTNIAEGFAYRKESIFPQGIVSRQMKKIDDKEYSYEHIELERDQKGITAKRSKKLPISQFPVNKKQVDKTGVLVVWERPVKNPEFGLYYASVDPVSEGKAEWVENKIYTPSGKKRIGDIKVGDYVSTPDGKSSIVTGVYPQGKKELYRVTFNDGSSLLVCEEHLWAVYSYDKKEPYILSVKQLLDKKEIIRSNGVGFNKDKLYSTKTFYKNKNNSNKWKIPITKPIEFNYTSLPIDPYFLGLILGDGGISTRSLRFTSQDKELIDYIKSILPKDITIKHIKNYDYRISTFKNRNSITKKLRELNLMGANSKTKFIPDIYKLSSISDRLSLLQGLMDTDGSCTNNGAEYYTISYELMNGVKEIVESLGGIVKTRKKKTKLGIGYIYIVRVALPAEFNPFKLKRKAEKYKQTKNFSKYISNIQYEKVDEAVCIKIENEDGLYVSENGIVTHNTTTSDSLCSIFVYKNPVEVTRETSDGLEHFIEKDKIVAAWCGRYDDINKTHEQLEKIIEWYKAWTVVENNISLFIQHMIARKKQQYLVPKQQILFLKDLGSNRTVYQEYGWKNTGTLFKNHLISYAIEFIRENIDEELDENGEVISQTLGVERIPDPMLLKEMQAYYPGLNVDRLVAFSALIAFAKVQQSNRGYSKRKESDSFKPLDKSQNLFKLKYNPFSNIGRNSKSLGGKKRRSGFKNFR